MSDNGSIVHVVSMATVEPSDLLVNNNTYNILEVPVENTKILKKL